jgi:hypothetical protein
MESKTNLLFVNHSSVLLENNGWYIWTDPFFNTPAFGSWLSAPPMCLHPTQLLTQALANPDHFLICISHGHDDHLDDKLLSLFNRVMVATTKFESRGVFSRIQKLGFNKIIELNQSEFTFGPYLISGFIEKDHSRDDSIQLIRSNDITFVHANDCWFEWGESTWEIINNRKSGLVVHASQVQNATGSFPYGYISYSDSEAEKINLAFLSKHLAGVTKNFDKIEADYFLNYAGHVKILSNNSRINEKSGFVERCDIFNLLGNSNIRFRDRLLDMRPGDSFCSGEILKSVGNLNTTEKNVKEASALFWQEYSNGLVRDLPLTITSPQLSILLKKFGLDFEKYVLRRSNEIEYFRQILSYKIRLSVEGHESVEVTFPNYSSTFPLEFESVWEPGLAQGILERRLNWEVSYIGGLGKHRKSPPSSNDVSVIRWLTMFGYRWQNSPLIG